jgi:hypothetical protein
MIRLIFTIGLFISLFNCWLYAIHPSFDIMSLRPGSGDNQWAPISIGGMGWLEDGRLAVCSWGGNQGLGVDTPKRQGKFFILSGVIGATSKDDVEVNELATGLNECQGLQVVNNEIYLLEKHRIAKVVDVLGNGSYDQVELQTVGTGWFYDTTSWHHFALDLVYKDGFFYFNTGSDWPVHDEDVDRAATITVPLAGGSHEVLAGGIRNPDGLGLGPEGELFATINQGEYNPSSNLCNMRQDRYFGMATTPLQYIPDWGTDPDTWSSSNGLNIDPNNENGNDCWPVVVWFDHGETGASPGTPLMVKEGVYKGQMFVAENGFVGGIRRVFLERVREEYQGCVFYFIDGEWDSWSYGANSNLQGLECGVNRMIWGMEGDPALYIGGVGGGTSDKDGNPIGGSGNWNWNQSYTGLQRLTPSGTVTFDILAVRSKTDGFELEFTKPLGSGADNIDNYSMRTWWNRRQLAYGAGMKEENIEVNISSVQVVDNTKVLLEVNPNDLVRRNEYYIEVYNVTSESGESLRDYRAWYNLNSVGPADVLGGKDVTDPLYNPLAVYDDGLQCSDIVKVKQTSDSQLAKYFSAQRMHTGNLLINVPFDRSYHGRILDVRGAVVRSFKGNSHRVYEFSREELGRGVLFVALTTGGQTFSRRVVSF